MSNEGCILWTAVSPQDAEWSAKNPSTVSWSAILAQAANWGLLNPEEAEWLLKNPLNVTWILKCICETVGLGWSEQVYQGTGTKIRLYHFSDLTSERIYQGTGTVIKINVASAPIESQQYWVENGRQVQITGVM